MTDQTNPTAVPGQTSAPPSAETVAPAATTEVAPVAPAPRRHLLRIEYEFVEMDDVQVRAEAQKVMFRLGAPGEAIASVGTPGVTLREVFAKQPPRQIVI